MRWLPGWFRCGPLDAAERGALLVTFILFVTSGFIGGTAALTTVRGTTAAYTAGVVNVGNTFQMAGRFAPYDLAGAAVDGGLIRLTWTHESDLRWATTYHVYRGTTSGAHPTRLNGAAIPSCGPLPCTMTYDTTPPDSAIYYYVVRGVDSQGIEGPESNETSVNVDLSPPVVSAVAPYDGQINVSISPTVQIFFSEAMDLASTTAAVSLVPCTDNTAACSAPGQPVPIAVNWINGSTTAVFQPSGLSYNLFYLIRVSTDARDAAGNPLASSFASAFKTIASGAPPATPPHVVPPTSPVNQAQGVVTNTVIVVSFDQTMDQPTTQSAITLNACAAEPAQITSTTCAVLGPAVAINGFAWGGAAYNVLTMTPAGLAPLAWYQMSINTAAQNPSGQHLATPTSFVFQTAAVADQVAPDPPRVTAPAATAYTTATVYTISGYVTNGDSVTAEPNPLIRVYRDANGNAVLETGIDPLVASYQTSGDSNAFTLDIGLVVGTSNQLFLIAQDLAGNVSGVTTAPTINQSDPRTDPDLGTVAGGANDTGGTINVFAPFQGDADGDNTASVAPCQGLGCTSFDTATAMARTPAPGISGAGQFNLLLTGLGNSMTYTVKIVYSDPDGISNTANCNGGSTATTCTQLATAQTAATVNQSGLIEPPAGAIVFASRAQSATIPVTGTAKAYQVLLHLPNGATRFLPVSGQPGTTCGSAAPFAFVWDGKDTGGGFVPDGQYTYDIIGYNGNNCGNAANELVGQPIVVSNVASLTLAPPAGAVTLSTDQSVAVVVTVRNYRNEPVGDGAIVTFTATGSVTNTSFTLVRSTALTGQSYADCAALFQTVEPGSGKACTVLTVDTAVLQTITIQATIASQAPGTTTVETVAGTTTVNDPPSEEEPLDQRATGFAR